MTEAAEPDPAAELPIRFSFPQLVPRMFHGGETLIDVPILRAGRDLNGYHTSRADIDEIVISFSIGGFYPPITLDHISDMNSPDYKYDYGTYGHITTLRRRGEWLLAKLEHVPQDTIRMIEAGELTGCSVELYLDTEIDDRACRIVLRGLAFLPPDVLPAVVGLPPLSDALQRRAT